MSNSTQFQSQNEELVRNILFTQFGRDALEVSLSPRSNNTKVYILSIGPGTDKRMLSDTPCCLGTEPLPATAIKAVMRFTDPDSNLNDYVRVENEVISMMFARDALRSLCSPLVPRVYGWSSAATSGNGWVLMEFIRGVPLDIAKFQNLDYDGKKQILGQIAQVVKHFQEYELPASVEGYGGLRFADDATIVIGPTPIHGATKPCESYHELYNEYLQTQLAFMDKCDIVQGWKDTALRSRIDDFVATGFKPLLERCSELKPRQTLVHGDLDLHNLLFDPQTNSITGILDFDFSHIASAADEYFYSFNAIHGLLAPPSPGDPLDMLRKCMLHGFNSAATEKQATDVVNWEVAMLTDEALFLSNVRRPIEMMPGIELLSELYWFIQNISPGLFFLPRVRAKMTPERASSIRRHIQEDLDKTLSGWGF